MNLHLLRKTFTETPARFGHLSVDGKPECFTFEDKVRAVKIQGQTSDPRRYLRITITLSDKFKKPPPGSCSTSQTSLASVSTPGTSPTIPKATSRSALEFCEPSRSSRYLDLPHSRLVRT